jgi:hypothetical protein
MCIFNGLAILCIAWMLKAATACELPQKMKK